MEFREWVEATQDIADRGAGCVFTDGQRILLLLRSQGTKNPNTWGIPAGHAQEGETPLQTAHRETKEETGVDPSFLNKKKLGESNERQGRWVVFVYLVDKPFECKLNEEHSAYKWIEFDNLQRYPLHPLFKRNMTYYLSLISSKKP
jgi:ADP-ribose pyrophosphatase YjhB (NUDIX family)